jgi:IS5 family transposase
MSPDRLDHVFDLFGQLDPSCERTDSGLRIGLHLAKRIAELHGGQVTASSGGLNRGSEFLVRLPVANPAAAETRPTAKESFERSGAMRRILIADDNHDAAVSLSMLIEAMGHETRIAYDGRRRSSWRRTSAPISYSSTLECLRSMGMRQPRESRSVLGRPIHSSSLSVVGRRRRCKIE